MELDEEDLLKNRFEGDWYVIKLHSPLKIAYDYNLFFILHI